MVKKTSTKKEGKVLEEILQEIKEIKRSLKIFLDIVPEEDVEGYEHPQAIKKSHEKALKKYPV